MAVKSCIGDIISSKGNLVAQQFRLLAKRLSQSTLGETGIYSVGGKSVEIRKKTNSVGRLLGRF